MGSYNLDCKQKKIDLYFTYSERYTGGSIIGEGDDGDDRYAYYNPSYTEFEPEGLYLKRPSGNIYIETLSLPFDVNVGDVVYVTLVRYSTGNTFGQCCGYWYLEGVYQDEETAVRICESINDDSYIGKAILNILNQLKY